MFDLGSLATLQAIFVELVVSVLDSDGRPATTTLSASLPVAQGGVSSWCYTQAAKAKAEDYIDTVDIVVGSAGSARDLGQTPDASSAKTSRRARRSAAYRTK